MQMQMQMQMGLGRSSALWFRLAPLRRHRALHCAMPQRLLRPDLARNR